MWNVKFDPGVYTEGMKKKFLKEREGGRGTHGISVYKFFGRKAFWSSKSIDQQFTSIVLLSMGTIEVEELIIKKKAF